MALMSLQPWPSLSQHSAAGPLPAASQTAVSSSAQCFACNASVCASLDFTYPACFFKKTIGQRQILIPWIKLFLAASRRPPSALRLCCGSAPRCHTATRSALASALLRGWSNASSPNPSSPTIRAYCSHSLSPRGRRVPYASDFAKLTAFKLDPVHLRSQYARKCLGFLLPLVSPKKYGSPSPLANSLWESMSHKCH